TALIHNDGFRRATFGGPRRATVELPWRRVVIRPVALRGQVWLQFSYFDAKKDITKNYRGAEADDKLDQLLGAGFAGIHITTAAEEIDIRLTKKGRLQIGRKRIVAEDTVPRLSHNRAKELLLPEGRADRLLEVMGILTQEGHVKPTMRAKFNQVNEFHKHLAHT